MCIELVNSIAIELLRDIVKINKESRGIKDVRVLHSYMTKLHFDLAPSPKRLGSRLRN